MYDPAPDCEACAKQQEIHNKTKKNSLNILRTELVERWKITETSKYSSVEYYLKIFKETCDIYAKNYQTRNIIEV